MARIGLAAQAGWARRTLENQGIYDASGTVRCNVHRVRRRHCHGRPEGETCCAFVIVMVILDTVVIPYSHVSGGTNMGLKEFMTRLEQHGVHAAEHQLRYALKAGKITRPELDLSLRFQFEDQHIEECRRLFGNQHTTA